jgi:hypothetical protein
MLFSLIILRGTLINPITSLFKLEGSLIDEFLDIIGFHSQWNMFTGGPDGYFWDIKIKATTDKKTYIWYLLRDSVIGNIKINSFNSRLTLVFHYTSGNEYLNNIFYKAVKKYVEDQDQKLLKFNISEVQFSSYNSNEIIHNRKYSQYTDTIYTVTRRK